MDDVFGDDGERRCLGGTLRCFGSLLNYLYDSAEESIEELSSIPRV